MSLAFSYASSVPSRPSTRSPTIAYDVVAHAEAIEQALAAGGVRPDQVYHGDGIASWAVNRRDVERGRGTCTGLEDTPVLPDGRIASGNDELASPPLRHRWHTGRQM